MLFMLLIIRMPREASGIAVVLEHLVRTLVIVCPRYESCGPHVTGDVLQGDEGCEQQGVTVPDGIRVHDLRGGAGGRNDRRQLPHLRVLACECRDGPSQCRVLAQQLGEE